MFGVEGAKIVALNFLDLSNNEYFEYILSYTPPRNKLYSGEINKRLRE